jgi:hypothetical protein
MTKAVLTLCLVIMGSGVSGQIPRSNQSPDRFVGKYQFEEMILQFGLHKDQLVLVVPGAPTQILETAGKMKFRSRDFDDLEFEFIERERKITEVVSTEKGQKAIGKKIAAKADFTSEVMDSLLVFTYSTEHFVFKYSSYDSTIIDTLSLRMERDYDRILADFKLKQIPAVTVRVYPDLKSFHLGINLPNGPDEVLGTAFGKNDLRIVSPQNAGSQQWMLVYALPHEFTHCVHLTIDYAPNNPRWLWEAVAQYEAGWFFNPKDAGIVSKKDFPAFNNLTNGMEYMLGYVIIEAVRERWGADAVIELIKNRGNTQKALKLDQKMFEEKVVDYIVEKYLNN